MTNPIWQFTWANLCYLFSGKFRSPNGYTPRANHPIPADFSCIGVATSDNIETDSYVISQLKQLNIQRVRLDFTYGDFSKPAGRFLKQLIAEQFKVHLHLVQPFSEAKLMQTHSAQQTWQTFVLEVCEQFGKQVHLVEVGSTVNRKRWAGYTLTGFLKMWEIAHRIIKQSNITLAGPSVTDFEPLYNIGFLSLLKTRKQLPDIHTNNLFSERCTEPERDDHKIFGHRLAKLAGFRLIKKAYLLEGIGQYFNVPIMHSPSAFWTLPRIERLLPDSLQKQADYLARYMILSAASGAMQSAAWGPLMCHREGLIDDGIAKYPSLERITHYQSVSNKIDDYQIRPAFYAYKTFNRLIPDTLYLGQLNETDHLEVHAFKNNQFILHALWTTNGKGAALTDIYAGAKINHVQSFNRDGMEISLPSIITESPIYLCFNSNETPNVNPDAGVIKSLAIHTHSNVMQYFNYQQGEWRGVIAAKNAEEFNRLSASLNPALLQGPSQSTVLRKARNAIWTIDDPRDSTKKLAAKKPIKVPWFKKIIDRNKPSKALRSWNGANELLRRGIENAQPIAYFEHINDKTRTQNYYICEYVPSDFSVRDLFTSFAEGEPNYQGISQASAYAEVAHFLNNMHNKGVFFRDLSGGNILIKKQANNQLKFSLIDTGRAHFFNHGTAIGKRLSDMARACNKLHTDGRNALMTIYMQKMDKTFGLKEKCPFILYNAKVIFKRKSKRKNILKMLGIKKIS
jgi:tRNA A-37 threonylcarbamoyl transferase component Bud32